MREVYTFIQLICYFYPTGKPGHCDDRDHFFTPDFLKLFWGAASNEGRVTVGLLTEN